MLLEHPTCVKVVFQQSETNSSFSSSKKVCFSVPGLTCSNSENRVVKQKSKVVVVVVVVVVRRRRSRRRNVSIYQLWECVNKQ